MTVRLAVLATGFGLAVTGAALAHAGQAVPVAVPPAPVPATVAVASVSPPAEAVPYVRVPDCGDLPDGDGYADATCVTWDEDAYWVYTNGEGTPVAACTHEDSGPVMPCVWDPANMGNGLPDGPVLYVLNFSE